MDALVRPLPTRKDSDEGVQATFFNRLLKPKNPSPAAPLPTTEAAVPKPGRGVYLSPPPQIDQAHREQADADDRVHVEEGDVDAAQVVGADEGVFVEEQSRHGDDAC